MEDKTVHLQTADKTVHPQTAEIWSKLEWLHISSQTCSYLAPHVLKSYLLCMV